MPLQKSALSPSTPIGLSRSTIGTLQHIRGNAHVQRSLSANGHLKRQGAAPQTLKMGSRGPAVSSLQQQLNSSGASVATDGIFGAGTRAAVIAYQQSAGLTADGIVGPQTWQRLSGSTATTTSGEAAQKTPPDPLQAVVAAKLGQVRAALQGVKAKGGAATATKDAGAAAPLKPIQGKPIPLCGIPIPTGDGSPAQGEHAGHAHGGLPIQRDWLDDAADWAGDAADSAAEWAGDKVDDVTHAASNTASWVGDQVSAAGDWVDEHAEAVSEMAGEAVNAASDLASETAQAASNAVDEIVSTAKETVEGGIDVVVQTASELAKDVGEFSDDLKKRYAKEIAILEEVVQGLGSPFGDLGGMAKRLDEILSGLLGGGAASTGFFGLFEDDPAPKPIQVYAMLDIEGSITQGGVKVPGTGYSEPTYSIEPITWNRVMDDMVMVQAKVKVDCHWDIAGEGRGTNITSANDPSIIEISYLTAIHDLEAMSQSYLSNAPVQTTFWSKPLIERHEIFHCHDYIQQATRYISKAQSWMETQQVTEGKGGNADIDKQVHALIAQMRQNFEDDGMTYFKNGGEARAYGDGKGAYDALIAAIKARAKTEKWK